MSFFDVFSPVYLVLIVLGIVAVIVLCVVLVRIKMRQAQKILAEYFEANEIAATPVDCGLPPIRLWFHNRKYDMWCKIRLDDGTSQWARIRNPLSSERQIDFFD